MYREISKEKESVANVRQLLSIYITLLENVFFGKPHAKILWLLHGAKKVMTRKELVESSAFQPAVVLKAIHDLARANLVKYDDQTDTVTLVTKIF